MATIELIKALPCNICILSAIVVVVFFLSLYISSTRRFYAYKLKGQHVVITGGSSGIGKAIAQQALEKGASVTLVARNLETLRQVQEELQPYETLGEKVWVRSVDVGSDIDLVQREFDAIAQESRKPIDVLINCAGTSVPGVFEELDPGTFEKMMRVNYFGSVFPTRAVVPAMKERRAGRILFVSSQAGQVGIFGFTAYSGSKFALVGFAQALRMELQAYGIKVCVAYPPDTDTPGFEEENKCKPEETKILSETSGLFSAQEVATDIINGLLGGDFSIYTGLDGWMLSNVTAGMSPPNSAFHGLVQVLLNSFLRLIALFYSSHFDAIVKSCMKKREMKKERLLM